MEKSLDCNNNNNNNEYLGDAQYPLTILCISCVELSFITHRVFPVATRRRHKCRHIDVSRLRVPSNVKFGRDWTTEFLVFRVANTFGGSQQTCPFPRIQKLCNLTFLRSLDWTHQRSC